MSKKITSIKGFNRDFYAHYDAIGGKEILEKTLFSALSTLLKNGTNLAKEMNSRKEKENKKEAA